MDRKWLTENPAKVLKMPKNTDPPVEPFTPEEVDKILAAIADRVLVVGVIVDCAP
jgi:hypothetical protein